MLDYVSQCQHKITHAQMINVCIAITWSVKLDSIYIWLYKDFVDYVRINEGLGHHIISTKTLNSPCKATKGLDIYARSQHVVQVLQSAQGLA